MEQSKGAKDNAEAENAEDRKQQNYVELVFARKRGILTCTNRTMKNCLSCSEKPKKRTEKTADKQRRSILTPDLIVHPPLTDEKSKRHANV
jgi:hypothetical protein